MQKLAKVLALFAAVSFTGSVLAVDASCSAYVAKKKLAGAAKTSFLQKCERDATSNCEATSDQKKLVGATKASFVKKCVKDAVGQ